MTDIIMCVGVNLLYNHKNNGRSYNSQTF